MPDQPNSDLDRCRLQQRRHNSTQGRQVLFRVLKLVLGCAAVFFVVRALAAGWPSVTESIGKIGWQPLLTAFTLLVLSTILQLLAWRLTLRSYRSLRIPLRAAAATYTVSQIAKYIPGSIWPAVVQSEFGKRYNVEPSIMYASFFIQLASSVGVAALLTPLVWIGPSAPWVRTVSAIALAGGVLLLFLVFRQDLITGLANRLPFFRRFSVPRVRDRKALLWATGAILLSWIMAGAQVVAISAPIGATSQDIPFIIGANALSWVVGLAIVFLPAGAGAREGVIVLTLGFLIGNTEALTIAILSRFIQVVVDIFLTTVLGWPLLHSTKLPVRHDA